MRVTGAKRNPNLSNFVVSNTTGGKPTIHNVFIVDASGSMGGSKYDNAISGLNELIKSIKSDVDSENTLTIVEFEGHSVTTRLKTTKDIPEIYHGMGTGGMTPLNKAVGETIEEIVLLRAKKYNVSDKILVNVFTDGGENSSHGSKYANSKFLGNYIKKLEDESVTVTFIGTEEEVAYATQDLKLNISNTLVHDNSALGVMDAFNTTVLARTAYSKSVASGEDVKIDFYTKVMVK